MFKFKYGYLWIKVNEISCGNHSGWFFFKYLIQNSN
jgi:hypothetical protein